jgi:hypothetical protein
LRDILEVLYIDKDKLKDSSLITELDAYLDEVLHNWQNNFLALVKAELNNSEETSFNPDLGIVHKSIVLLKQEKVLELALKGYTKPRLERIHSLMKHAQKFNASLAISAQLPGFKLQLENEIIDERNKSHNWDLVKKMLTRYNWLSTRLNDDAVPPSGLIYGIVLDRRLEQTKTLEFETLVPLRQRRLKDLFGENWERKYYKNNPHPNDILTFVDRAGFEARLKGMNN